MFLAFVVLLGACKGSQPADTTDVLVSVKGRTLNRSEVNKLIPRGISSADSLLLAESFTKKWVRMYWCTMWLCVTWGMRKRRSINW